MATITATTRTEIGTNAVKQIRRAGNIPAIVYGHGETPVAVTIGEHDVELAIQHGERLVDLELDGKHVNVMFKEVQWDTFGHQVLHVDLARVNLNESVEITVPVTLVGTPEGAREGGVLQQLVSEVQIQCLVRNMPEEIRLLVTEMNKDDRKTLADLELPEGATLLDDENDLLCQVVEIAEEEEAEEGEEMAEPEVIGAKEEEETEE